MAWEDKLLKPRNTAMDHEWKLGYATNKIVQLPSTAFPNGVNGVNAQTDVEAVPLSDPVLATAVTMDQDTPDATVLNSTNNNSALHTIHAQ